MAFSAVLGLAVLVFTLGATLFALIVGGRVERLGAGLYAVGVLCTWSAQLFIAQAPFVAFLVIDTATALLLGVLAVRNPEKLWPGVAGVGQTLVVVFSATRALQFPMSETAYIIALNLSALLVVLPMGFAAWLHRWGRKPDEAEAELAYA